MHWFYSPEVKIGNFHFNPDESKHITRVLRLDIGDDVFITDGRGRLFSGKIIDDNHKKCVVEISNESCSTSPPSYCMHIAVAPTKNLSRIEWFVEKATEFGIQEITPMHCDHSERTHFKSERLQRIAIAAIKQSQQVWLPKINEITNFKDIIRSIRPEEGFIAYVDNDNTLPLLKSIYTESKNATVLIGPEGDFSKSEIHAAIAAGFIPISLGKNRLRTETAALAACFTIHLINQK
ncbi:MAG: 16S rRNA (uracil(1498)-N(3))-methyltransferase [Bacteroidales bacterium]|nr:16S rRNA (uracil(1498)-N(3))-methyltransferase [Bacteroidales bacterium]